MTDTTNTKAWQEPNWTITPLNFSGLVVSVDPPAPAVEYIPVSEGERIGRYEIAEPSQAIDEDSLDAQDAEASLKDSRPSIPWEDVKEKLGL